MEDAEKKEEDQRSSHFCVRLPFDLFAPDAVSAPEEYKIWVDSQWYIMRTRGRLLMTDYNNNQQAMKELIENGAAKLVSTAVKSVPDDVVVPPPFPGNKYSTEAEIARENKISRFKKAILYHPDFNGYDFGGFPIIQQREFMDIRRGEIDLGLYGAYSPRLAEFFLAHTTYFNMVTKTEYRLSANQRAPWEPVDGKQAIQDIQTRFRLSAEWDTLKTPPVTVVTRKRGREEDGDEDEDEEEKIDTTEPLDD